MSVDSSLRDSFDTPSAIRAISELVTKYNSLDSQKLPYEVVKNVTIWITEIIKMFGLDDDAQSSIDGRTGWSGIEIAKYAQPYVYTLSAIRDNVRRLAIDNKISEEALPTLRQDLVDDTPPAPESVPYQRAVLQFNSDLKTLARGKKSAKEFLALCDRLRDETLWNLGIYLEDREGQPAMVRPFDQELLKARKEKAEIEAVKARAKLERQAEAARRDEIARICPSSLFKTSEFSEWDDMEFPIKDSAGEHITKSQAKKLRKDLERQKKLHDGWLKTQKS